MEMKIEKFVLGPVGTNCYIVRNEDTMECFIVDMAACPPELVSHIKNAGLTAKAVLLTHGHFDHIMGLDRFLEEFPVQVYACGAEKELLENAQMNSSAGMLGQPYTFTGAQFVKDGDLLQIAGMNIQVIVITSQRKKYCSAETRSFGRQWDVQICPREAWARWCALLRKGFLCFRMRQGCIRGIWKRQQ